VLEASYGNRRVCIMETLQNPLLDTIANQLVARGIKLCATESVSAGPRHFATYGWHHRLCKSYGYLVLVGVSKHKVQ
jgi:hypothetical protein